MLGWMEVSLDVYFFRLCGFLVVFVCEDLSRFSSPSLIL